MASRLKILNSDKEVNAFKTNMKEQRCLTKNLTILDAEASYSCRLLDLDSRSIRVFFKRFKDKVTKIRSKLTSEEISQMRAMEESGLLPLVTRPTSMSGALKIADAEKRLKLPQSHKKTENAQKAEFAHELHRRYSLIRASLDSDIPLIAGSRCNITSAPASLNDSIQSPRIRERKVSHTSIKSSSPVTSPRVPPVPTHDCATPGSVPIVTNHRTPVVQTEKPSPVEQTKFVRTPTDLKDHTIPSILITVDPVKPLDYKSVLSDQNTKKIKETPGTSPFQSNQDEVSHDNRRRVSIASSLVPIKEIPEHTKIASQGQKIKKPTKSHSACAYHSSGKESSVTTTKSAVPRISDGNYKPKRGSILNKYSNKRNSQGEDSNAKHVTIVEAPLSSSNKSTKGGRSSAASIKSRAVSSAASNKTRNSSASSGKFSCHNPGLQDFKDTNVVYSFGNDNDDLKIGGYLGEDPYEERRKDLMEAEKHKTETIMDKQTDFIDRLDRYLEEQHRQNQKVNINTDFRVPDHILLERRRAAGARAKATRLQNLHKRMQRNSIADAERMKRVFESMQDVNKCRYLRVSSEKIDLSGIVTLATEQMKLLSGLKMGDYSY